MDWVISWTTETLWLYWEGWHYPRRVDITHAQCLLIIPITYTHLCINVRLHKTGVVGMNSRSNVPYAFESNTNSFLCVLYMCYTSDVCMHCEHVHGRHAFTHSSFSRRHRRRRRRRHICKCSGQSVHVFVPVVGHFSDGRVSVLAKRGCSCIMYTCECRTCRHRQRWQRKVLRQLSEWKLGEFCVCTVRSECCLWYMVQYNHMILCAARINVCLIRPTWMQEHEQHICICR